MTPEEKTVRDGVDLLAGAPTVDDLRTGLRQFQQQIARLSQPSAPIMPQPIRVEVNTVSQPPRGLSPATHPPDRQPPLPPSFRAYIVDGGETVRYRLFGHAEPEDN